MSRLVAFGCSNSYGQGLEDCWDAIECKPKFVPSIYAWPNRLSNRYGIQCINMSCPGSSNLEILFNILTFNFLPDDLAIVLWTTELRSCIFHPDKNENEITRTQLGPWSFADQNLISSWLNANNDYNLKIQSLFQIHHAEQYLENKKIKNFSFFSNENLFLKTPKFLKIKNGIDVDMSPFIFKMDKALDGGHPGPVAHKAIAKFMFDNIKL